MERIEKNPRWTPQELEQNPNVWQIQVPEALSQALLEKIKLLQNAPYEETTIDVIPREMKDLLHTVSSVLEYKTGVFLLKGLPVESLDVNQAKQLYFALGNVLGTPIFQDSLFNRLVDIKATSSSEEDAMYYKAKAEGGHFRPYETNLRFSFHSDPCDVAGLLCIKNAKQGGETRITSAVTLHDLLLKEDPSLVDALFEPYFYAKPETPGKPLDYHKIPVFSEFSGYFKTHVVPDLVWLAQKRSGIPKLTALQTKALQRLEELAYKRENHVEFTLAPGDLLFLNNHLVYHARTEYTDQPDNQRHLLRLWLSMPNSRPLNPIHEKWFGDSKAGRLRGGFLRAKA